jgi:hypothetical protein
MYLNDVDEGGVRCVVLSRCSGHMPSGLLNLAHAAADEATGWLAWLADVVAESTS